MGHLNNMVLLLIWWLLFSFQNGGSGTIYHSLTLLFLLPASFVILTGWKTGRKQNKPTNQTTTTKLLSFKYCCVSIWCWPLFWSTDSVRGTQPCFLLMFTLAWKLSVTIPLLFAVIKYKILESGNFTLLRCFYSE